MSTTLALPPHYDPANVVNDERWIDYMGLQSAATEWRLEHDIKSRVTDRTKIGVLGIDVQNTFCHPKGELFVGGASGTGAIDDSQRLVEFIYHNLGVISNIDCTLDTHRLFAVFHPSFLVNDQDEHPAPFTTVSHKDVVDGVWKPDPLVASALGVSLMAVHRQLLHYTEQLALAGRYDLTIWPYHGMLGDKGHNLVSGLMEAKFFHGSVRGAQPGFEIKGTSPYVESYSVLGPEVTKLFDGTPVPRNTHFIEQLLNYDYLIIAGQAMSHCVAWTIDDLLREILAKDPNLAKKVYILEDCTTPIVAKAPDGTVIYDYTPDAEAAFAKFKNAGMHAVRSTDPIESWPGIRL